jgi:oligopeptide transport system substrate-binding protein
MQLIEGAQEVMVGSAETITGLTAIDDKTLEIRLTTASPTFINALAHYNTGFMKMEDVGEAEDFTATADTRVNGAFMVEQWDVDAQQHVIVQNPAWWGETKPYLQRIIAQPAPDENVSFIMWQNDEVDIAHWLTNIREPLRASEPDAFVLIPYATNFFFPLWTTLEPTNDINLRKALVHAVDWDAAVAAAWEGARNDRVMKTHLTPELPCFKADNWPEYGYNPELAQEELAASSYGSVENLPKIRITTNGQSPNYIRMAEIMVEQWRNNLGITDVEIRPGPLDAWGQEVDQVQVRRSSWGATIPSPADMIAGLVQWATNPDNPGLVDEELEAMAAELRTLSPDDPQFCSKVQATEAKLLGHYYFLPMIWDLYEYNVKPWVRNFDTNVDNNWTGLLDMYIADH